MVDRCVLVVHAGFCAKCNELASFTGCSRFLYSSVSARYSWYSDLSPAPYRSSPSAMCHSRTLQLAANIERMSYYLIIVSPYPPSHFMVSLRYSFTPDVSSRPLPESTYSNNNVRKSFISPPPPNSCSAVHKTHTSLEVLLLFAIFYQVKITFAKFLTFLHTRNVCSNVDMNHKIILNNNEVVFKNQDIKTCLCQIISCSLVSVCLDRR